MTNRRDFLKLSCGAAGLVAFEQSLDRFGLLAHAASASPPNQYRALVCIFMFGGNDANNMVIPVTAGGLAGTTSTRRSRGSFARDSAARGHRLRDRAPERRAQLRRPSRDAGAARRSSTRASSRSSRTSARSRAGRRRRRSTARTRPTARTSSSRTATSSPRGWRAARTSQTNDGWGGLTADALASLNTGTSFPSSLSLAGNNQFNIGQTIKSLNVAPAPTALNAIFPLNGFTVGNVNDNARRTAFNTLRGFDTGVPLVKATSDITQQGLDIQASLAAGSGRRNVPEHAASATSSSRSRRSSS